MYTKCVCFSLVLTIYDDSSWAEHLLQPENFGYALQTFAIVLRLYPEIVGNQHGRHIQAPETNQSGQGGHGHVPEVPRVIRRAEI